MKSVPSVFSLHILSGVNGQSWLNRWQSGLIFLFIFAGLVVTEITIAVLFTGYWPNQLSLMLWDNLDFLLVYFTEEPIDTLIFVFLDKPLLVIDSRLQAASTSVWGLHFYSYTLVFYLAISAVLTRLLLSLPDRSRASNLTVFTGAGLLLLASTYLYLGSCCSGGANWIVHTWLLAIAFNPLTATEFVVELYQAIYKWLFWLQLMVGVFGAYLVFKGFKRQQSA